MPSMPGRPISPTLHPRTKGPAEDIARKLKSTSDWFRHDGKNIKNEPTPPVRLHHQQALDAAEKNKSKADQWFQHHPQTVFNGEPKPKGTIEAGKNSDKIKGVDEKWFKHDDNVDYSSPIVTHKILSGEMANETKDKIGNAETMDWYRHDHKSNGHNGVKSAPPQKGKARHVSNNMRPNGTPSWAVYEVKEESLRTHHGKAKGCEDYLERNRDGSDWFNHDTAVPISSEAFTPRCATAEGAEIAIKNRAESADWYNKNEKSNLPHEVQHHKGQSDATRIMVERSRGGAMEYVMRQPTSAAQNIECKVEQDERGDTPLPPAPEPRVSGEMAHSIQEKNVKGMMDQFICQDLNTDYRSARAVPRVRESAAQCTQAKGHTGVMADCLTGYPGTPCSKGQAAAGRAVKPEANGNANRGRGTVQRVISAPDTIPSTDRPGQRVKPEAAMYAERNKGTLGRSMNMDGTGEQTNRPNSRAGNELAQSLALRNRGTMGNIIFG